MAAFSYNIQNNNIMNVDYSEVQNLQNPPPIIKMHCHMVEVEPNSTIFNTNINDNNNNNGCPEISSSPAQCLQEQLRPYTDDHPSSVYVGCYKVSDVISSIINDPNYSLAYKTCTTHDSSSSVTDKLHGHGEQQQQQEVTTHEDEDKRSKYSKEELFSVDSSSPSQEKMDGKRKKRGLNNKVEEKKKRRKTAEEKKDDNKKKGTVVTVVEETEPKTTGGYIHVRARRGQATDNHSLAERVRREKISERMKMLQALVPGCHKVTGKALMLDEIINYVQSLQNQVEFLSMKLASLNPMFYDFGLDLDSFMTRPHQTLCSLEPAAMLYHDDHGTLANNIANNCGQVVVDSSSFQFLPQNNNIHSHQAKGQVLWDVEHGQNTY